jgi:exodeoxyribonuclease V gamma subunit
MIRLPEDDLQDEAAREDEPFAMDQLSETVLLREVFLDALGQEIKNVDASFFERLYNWRVESRVRRGLMPIGLFGSAECQRHLECLMSWYKQVQRQNLLGGASFGVCRFGHAGEAEDVDRLESAVLLDIPLTSEPDGPGGPPTVLVELFGRTEIIRAQPPASITPVLRDKPRLKDFLAGFLDAVILSMVPSPHDRSTYNAYIITNSSDVGSSRCSRTFSGIDQVRARTFLVTVLSDLLSGAHPYLLPCEAVFDYLGEKQILIESSVERMKEDAYQPCSSRYGPVPGFERYAPPDPEHARELIERRFGLFRDAGGMGT